MLTWEVLISAPKCKVVKENLKAVLIALFKTLLIEPKKIERLIISRNGITV